MKGTVFNFRSYPKSTEAELTLVEGAVDMDFTVSGIRQSVEITPGQVVKADLENGKVTRTCMRNRSRGPQQVTFGKTLLCVVRE